MLHLGQTLFISVWLPHSHLKAKPSLPQLLQTLLSICTLMIPVELLVECFAAS